MKNTIFITFAFLVLMTSCNNDNDMNDLGIPSNTISAKIDGRTFSVDAQSQINNVFVQFFSIAGVEDVGNGEYETLVLLLDFPIEETISEGDYGFNGFECSPTAEICGSIAYGIRNPDDELTHSSLAENGNGNSSFTFTDLDYRPGGNAVGTFSAVLFNEDGEEINITDGKFNVTIAE